MSDEPVISLENVGVHFEQESKGFFSGPDIVRAVDDVTLDIPENEVIALVGESGCGKTTLGRTAIGLQRPTEGSVRYRGHDIWEAKKKKNPDIEFSTIRKALQIIHQDPGNSLNPNKRVLSILNTPLKQIQPELDSEDREARILAMLDRVGISPPEAYVKRYPHQLSGGEQQRIALIRSLLMNPDLILADEAISAVDVSLRVELMDLMLELQDLVNTSYLFISHDLANARYFAEKAGGRIGVMYLGEIVEIGPAKEIVQDPKHPYTQVLDWATAELDPEALGKAESPPVRNIDIPDPVNPPSGCRFHTRCPKAREVCQEQRPALYDTEGAEQRSACFRSCGDDHEYWESAPLDDESPGGDKLKGSPD